jgi:hypothetical protein
MRVPLDVQNNVCMHKVGEKNRVQYNDHEPRTKSWAERWPSEICRKPFVVPASRGPTQTSQQHGRIQTMRRRLSSSHTSVSVVNILRCLTPTRALSMNAFQRSDTPSRIALPMHEESMHQSRMQMLRNDSSARYRRLHSLGPPTRTLRRRAQARASRLLGRCPPFCGPSRLESDKGCALRAALPSSVRPSSCHA